MFTILKMGVDDGLRKDSSLAKRFSNHPACWGCGWIDIGFGDWMGHLACAVDRSGPYHLRPDLREDYLRMSIFTSTNVGDAAIAEKAWSELEDTAEETLAVVRNQPRYLSEAQIASFMLLVNAEMEEVIPPEVEVEEPETEEPAEGSGINWLLIGGLCIVVLVAVLRRSISLYSTENCLTLSALKP
jgi:hypothetical protein